MAGAYSKKLKPRGSIGLHIAQVALVMILGLAWEGCARNGLIDTFYFSSPAKIIANTYSWALSGLLWGHLLLTLAEAAVGFLCGLVFGMAVGFIFAANRRLDAFLQPFITVMNAMPRIAFAPLIILWFGFGFASKVVMVVSLVFFVVFFNTYRGYKEVNPLLLKNAAVLGASRLQVLTHIYLPASLSWTFASLRVSVGFAVIGAILGEYMGASGGIGYLIDNAQSNFDATGVMSGLTVLTIVVAILDLLLRRVETYFLKWRTAEQVLES